MIKITRKKVVCLCLSAVLIGQSIFVPHTPTEPRQKTAEAATSYQDVYSFPASYQAKLKALKQKHPNWKFERVNVNISWSQVVQKEAGSAINTIQSNAPKGGGSGNGSAPLSYLSTRKDVYDSYTDTYKVVDGRNLYAANADVIAYYMDPRNFLTETQIFQFLSLKYESNQTLSGVQKILNNTFMSGNYTYIVKKKKKKKTKKKKVTKNYAQTFLTAGKKYSVSPYFLAVRSRQEVGTTLGTATSGTYKGYQGYYNFFNIGASDSANGGAAVKGLAYAKASGSYGRPWNSQYKAILGGAEFLAKDYISVGQNTFYFQKYSVVRSGYRYWHQYMSNITAISSEAANMYSTYRSMGILNQQITFRIPVYTNMPQTATHLPKSQGCSNNYLKSLAIKLGGKKKTLITKKNYTKKKTFSFTVVPSVSKVKISAKSCCKNAKISGAKTYSLTAGKTKKIAIKVKAQNKEVRTYNISVTRLKQGTLKEYVPPKETDSK